jgi:hypothetical protein
MPAVLNKIADNPSTAADFCNKIGAKPSFLPKHCNLDLSVDHYLAGHSVEMRKLSLIDPLGETRGAGVDVAMLRAEFPDTCK